MASTKHKTKPLSIKAFQEAYDVPDPNAQEEYKVYLSLNADRHHYGKCKTLTVWKQKAIRLHRTA